MAHNHTQITHIDEAALLTSLTESVSFPVLELEGISPSPSSYPVSEAGFSDYESHSAPLGDQETTPSRLTVELLGTTTQPATFDLEAWQWSQPTQGETIHTITPRQRTLSVLTIHGAPVPIPMLRPIPATVPEALPSLYAPSQAGDEEYDDEDDATEADSIFFYNGDQGNPQIRTTPSIPSVLAAEIIEPEAGFDAPEAFADFDDLAIIVAALRNADGTPTDSMNGDM